MEVNFLNYLDTALDLISPFTTIYRCSENDENKSINVAEHNAEAMLCSKELRSILESLIAQTFAFSNVALDTDKKPLTAMCQRILKECIAFEKESSLEDSKVCPNEQARKLKATILENSLYQLENLISECLLRMVCEVFSDFDNGLLVRMRNLNGEKDEEKIDKLTNEFDCVIDRLLQIGLFAITYAGDYKTASTIRSCLASLEALDSYLIPSLFSHNKRHSEIIQRHWLEEMNILRVQIQKIVDTNAFSLSLIDIIEIGIESLKKDFNYDLASALLRKANLFKQHLDINKENLKIDLESQSVKDFKLMFKECSAILSMYKDGQENIKEEKILKRFRILLKKLKMIQNAIGCSVKISKKEEFVEEEGQKANSNELKEFFDSFDIRPPSILYRTRRNSEVYSPRSSTNYDVFSPRSSTKIIKDISILHATPERKIINLHRKNSLRKAMFKKNAENFSNEDVQLLNQSMSLHLTEILDQITDLSTTLTSGQQNQINENVEILENHKIRISITSEI